MAVTLSASIAARIVDCTDPSALSAQGVRPDDLAHHDRRRTQSIARRLHDRSDASGLRWWSALTGAWHTVVIFTDRESRSDVTFGLPRHLAPEDDAVKRALEMLGIRVR